MKDNLIESTTLVLQHEGGFVNHPKDPGGMTNLGVTQKVWEDWLGRPVTETEMRSLTPVLVSPMYKQKYWDKVCGDQLPSGIDFMVFDCAVNSGPSRAAKILQKVLGMTEDGVIGQQTLGGASTTDKTTLIRDYSEARLAFLKGLPTWPTFGAGWEARVKLVSSEATRMSTT